jgi:hypothetical protein
MSFYRLKIKFPGAALFLLLLISFFFFGCAASDSLNAEQGQIEPANQGNPVSSPPTVDPKPTTEGIDPNTPVSNTNEAQAALALHK